MDSESTNLPSGGSDNAQPSDDLSKSLSLDDAASLDIDFDDEDQGTEANASETDPESETDAPPDGQEAEDEADDETEGAKPDGSEPAITLSDGTKLTLKDVEQGFLRERDYRHKTQELANSRRSVGELQARLEKASDAIADFLAKSIPPAPASELMLTDPLAHYQQMQSHNTALQQVHALLEQGNVVKEVGKSMTKAEYDEEIGKQREALLQRIPQLRDPKKMDKFGQEIALFATEKGFTSEELAKLIDHRYIDVLHDAMRFRQMEKARQTVKEKVANAPPVAAPQRAAKQVTADSARQQAIRERFRKSGSIHDAAKLEW